MYRCHGLLHINMICGRWQLFMMQLFVLTLDHGIKRTEGVFPFNSNATKRCIPSMWPRYVVITSCRLWFMRDWLLIWWGELPTSLTARCVTVRDLCVCVFILFPLTQHCVRPTLSHHKLTMDVTMKIKISSPSNFITTRTWSIHGMWHMQWRLGLTPGYEYNSSLCLYINSISYLCTRMKMHRAYIEQTCCPAESL